MNALHPNRVLDDVDWRILGLLQENARLSFRKIGEEIGLTPPAVAERVRRLEESGVLTGYHATIDQEKLGLTITAMIHINTPCEKTERFMDFVQGVSEVLECYCVTGTESFIVKIAVESVQHLNDLLYRIKPYGDVRTSVILSTQVKRRTIQPKP